MVAPAYFSTPAYLFYSSLRDGLLVLLVFERLSGIKSNSRCVQFQITLRAPSNISHSLVLTGGDFRYEIPRGSTVGLGGATLKK